MGRKRQPGGHGGTICLPLRLQTQPAYFILKDFFRTYRNFLDSQTDTIEIMLAKLYEQWGIRDDTDFSALRPEDYPVLSDLLS